MKNPQLKVPTFHVTGTNGKGSVVRKLGASLLAAGNIYTIDVYYIQDIMLVNTHLLVC